MMQSATAARRVIAMTVLACGPGLLAACSSSATPAAGPTPTVTVTATPSPSSSSSVSGLVATPSSSAGASGGSSPSCATSALDLKIGQSNGAAGSVYVPIQFINTSGSACTLFGFPGVSFVTGVGGSQVGAPATEDHATTRKFITLGPDARAHALLRVVNALNFSKGACHPVSTNWLKVYPPGQTTAKYLSYKSQACSKGASVLSVQTVQAGSGNP